MSEETATSKLRLSGARSNRRLLKGYGPLAGLLIAFVLMAVLVPTVAPTQNVIHDTQSVASTGTGTGTTPAGTSTGTTAPGTTGTTAPTGTGAVATGSGTTGTAKAANGTTLGKTGGCGTQTEQVPGDPYSPPCVAFSGNNGGATSPGVSSSAINISYRITADSESFQQTLASLGGANITDTTADIERTINALATYFDNHFQLYGRKLNIEYFNGQGSITNELLGTGQQQADADAVTASQSLHAFAELNGASEPYGTALSAQHVVNFGVPYLSASFMGQYAPYMWSIDTEGNDVVSAVNEFYLKSFATGVAQYAGGSLATQQRKVAIIAPSNPWYQSSVTSAVAQAQAAGHPFAQTISYQLNLGTLSSQAANIVSELQNDGITTIICGCDPVFPVYLTSRAQEQGYTPEWVVAGVALTDTDIVGQLFQQSEWAHAFGVTFAGPTEPKQDTFGYAAYKSIDPNSEPANSVDVIYEQMYEMMIGLQEAGPDLTPTTFQAGMRAYPGSQAGASNALYGTWGFPPGHYTPQEDAAIIYWNPTKVSTYNDKQGAYVVGTTRYKTGQFPSAPVPVPSNFPIAP
ncbi:MAG TPA: ABC transporter substrate-binding protein [Acidimicrobiales bacterium]